MSVTRRQFNREFKEAAIRRLEVGGSIAEVARACEVNPNVLHRWKRELREHGPAAFSGQGTSGPKKLGLPNWNGRSADRRWRSIFCGDACSMQSSSGSCKH